MQRKRLLMVGLDNSGKTSIIYRMKYGKFFNVPPTQGFNIETLVFMNISFDIWDVGGNQTARSLWKYYYSGLNGIIFVIDPNDRSRIHQASIELRKILDDQKVKILMLINIKHKQYYMHKQEILNKLGLNEKDLRRIEIRTVDSASGMGIDNGLQLLSYFI